MSVKEPNREKVKHCYWGKCSIATIIWGVLTIVLCWSMGWKVEIFEVMLVLWAVIMVKHCYWGKCSIATIIWGVLTIVLCWSMGWKVEIFEVMLVLWAVIMALWGGSVAGGCLFGYLSCGFRILRGRLLFGIQREQWADCVFCCPQQTCQRMAEEAWLSPVLVYFLMGNVFPQLSPSRLKEMLRCWAQHLVRESDKSGGEAPTSWPQIWRVGLWQPIEKWRDGEFPAHKPGWDVPLDFQEAYERLRKEARGGAT